MGHKNRERRELKMQRKGQKPRSRSSVRFLVVSVIAVGIVAGLVFGYGWGPASSVAEQHIGAQDDNSVPLSTRGKPISGWHEMNVPSQSYQPLPPKGTPQPDITVTPTNRNLGSVGSKDVVNLHYSVVNRGSQDLVVDKMVTSCPCTTAELSNNVIPPGTRGDLKVRFDAGFHKLEPGEQIVRLVWLKTNDPDTPVAVARFTATIQ